MMEETILFPSPNWFLVSILGTTKDGWLVYGGPAKSLVVLEPISKEYEGAIDNNHRYKAHVVNKAHRERILSVDTFLEWPEKRHFITGSCDGVVKEWNVTLVDNKWTIKNIHSHEAHANEKEEVVAVGYSMATHVISVGNFSNLVLWELNTNVTKLYNTFMKNFRASCMSCSPHMAMVVAVGTKQGVVFVLDLHGAGKIVYKVRSQDDEISRVTWCPQYEVLLKRSLNEVVKKSLVTQRMEQIRNEREPGDHDESGVEKKLPEDSFDESVVQEDDMFDIYTDHAADEFGHKKYEPENIVVKVKKDTEKDDFLAECERLKAQILQKKNEDEESIETLVEAMDKTNIEGPSHSRSVEGEAKAVTGKAVTGVASVVASDAELASADASAHIHKHLLASIGKHGSIRIWSKTGKIVATCVVASCIKNVKQQGQKQPNLASICWYKPDTLLITDGKNQVLECNPLNIDCRNKLEWHIVHSGHRRGLYCITSNASRVQTAEMLSEPQHEEQWAVWTVAQDRFLIKYDFKNRKTLAKFGTCGGFLYNVKPCPYDAGKLAVGVGDGAIRIWETHSTGEEESKLLPGEIHCHWQHVQGKILQCVWHPTSEDLMAFSTAESRVGLIDISCKGERAARTLQPALSSGVYSLAWGEGMSLFAVGGGELVMYQANKPEQAPTPIRIEIEGQKWDPTSVNYSQHGLLISSNVGGVAIFSGPGGQALAAKFVYTKMIYSMEWHPQQTTSSDEESKYKNLLALCSSDKSCSIVILEYKDMEDEKKQFCDFATLTGHTASVLQVVWSPHRDGQLLSTSQDHTVRVWDVINGVCISIFDGHTGVTMGAAWCALPSLADKVISGSGDCCLRLWDINDYPAENYKEVKKEMKKRTKKRNKNKKKAFGRTGEDEKDSEDEKEVEENPLEEEEETKIVVEFSDWRMSKRFLLPILSKQVSRVELKGAQIMLQKYLEKNKEISNILDIIKDEDAHLYDLDFLKLFGTINEVNEVLDMECKNHLSNKSYEAYIMLMIFRGHIDSVMQFANDNDILDSFLLSIAPCVSVKYWKDVTQLFVAQIDRLASKNEDSKLYESKSYGGVNYRKAAALLSVHDVKGAVDLLTEVKLFKEAYILCRCRHIDSVAEEVLLKWGYHAGFTGNLILGALINVAIGNVSNAANILRRSKHQGGLNLAAELAKSAGLNTFADYIETKVKSVEKETTEEKDQTDEILEELPTKMEVLMKEKLQSSEIKTEEVNGMAVNGNGTAKSENETVSQSDE